KLVTWARGDTGGPVWERFLREGYVVVVADYRNPVGPRGFAEPVTPARASYADDGVAVVEYVRSLPYVDRERVHLYGVSLGGDVVLHTAARTKVRAAILGAPAPITFLGVSSPPPPPRGGPPTEPPKEPAVDEERARRNIEPVSCPVLILVGTADGLLPLD